MDNKNTPGPSEAVQNAAKSGETDSRAAAKEAARKFARSGVAGVQKLGGRLGQAIVLPVKTLLGLPLLLIQGSLMTRLISLGFFLSLGVVIFTGVKLANRFAPRLLMPGSVKTETGDSFNK